MKRIDVTRAFLPPIEEYSTYLEQIWDRRYLTNQGPLVKELEASLNDYLGIPEKLQFVTNGTLALQLAIRCLGAKPGEIITTPFSYVATTSAIMWERYEPVFADIDPETFCIDPDKVEAAITKKTRAILAVHVFGNPCNVEKLEEIGRKYKIPIIYDAAHAFGVKYKGKSLLSYGDISTCSFHTTKLFHTIEGGAIIVKDGRTQERVELMKRFGHNYDEHVLLGINAKASEFQAAMGLCNLRYIDNLIKARKRISKLYDKLLGKRFGRPVIRKGTEYNYSYYPVVLDNEKQLNKAMYSLSKDNIFPRRYFFPSLNSLPYTQNHQSCPVSDDIASRIICLPLFDSLEDNVVHGISTRLLKI